MSGERPFVSIGEVLEEYRANQDRARFRAQRPGEPEHPDDRLGRLVGLLDIDLDPEGHVMMPRRDVEWLIAQVIALRSELQRIADSEPAQRRRVLARLERSEP